MTKRRRTQGPTADDFREAKTRLKDIGSGLSSVFEAVSQLIEEAGKDGAPGQGGKTAPGRRLTSSFDVRVGTLDELGAGRAEKPAPANPKRAPVHPQAAEHHVREDGVLVIVTLGKAKAQDAALIRTQNGAAVTCGTWRYAMTAPRPLALQQVATTLRNGYLTFHIPFRSPAFGNETQQ
ncbi:MAG: hypothetical protein AAF221_05910 [Pseudomonadota bacterium]